jgi:hypothetical protein
MVHQIDMFCAEKYTEMVELFDQFDEGGVSMLDHAATMWLPELSDGNAHDSNKLTIVMAGSLGGYLKQGQVVG